MTNGPFDDGVLAQAWCSPENEHKEMDAVLCAELTRIANARYRELVKRRDDAIEIMRAALKFYSDECGGPYAPGDHHSVDGGLTASEALAECDRLLEGEKK